MSVSAVNSSALGVPFESVPSSTPVIANAVAGAPAAHSSTSAQVAPA